MGFSYTTLCCPAHDVSIVLSNPLGNFTDFTYTPKTVIFSSVTWDTPQTVRAVAVDDNYAEDRLETHEVHAEVFRYA